MRRVLLLLVVVAAVLALAGGMALAVSKSCLGDCVGTREADVLTGQFNAANFNRIAGMEGNDTITGGDTSDLIYGDEGNDTVNDGALNQTDGDTIYSDEGNDTIDVHENVFGDDTVNCGPGTKDKVFFDQGFDTVNRNCEIRRPG